MIRFSHVTKIYGSATNPTVALDDLSFHIQHHEFVSLFGPSGCGKSTCMHIMGCLDLPTSGHYELDEKSTIDLSQRQLSHIRNHKIGFVFQQYMLLPKLTALQNVGLPLFYRNQAVSDIRSKARDILSKLGLDAQRNHYPGQLSGGQQQRVAIARALIGEPDLILADEPTGALDSTNSQQFIELLTNINQEKQTTIVVITHNAEIAQHTHRILHLKDGKIVDST